METSFSFSEGYVNYSDALRQAIHLLHSGDAPKWDFSTWDYQTQLTCSAEESEAIQQYGVAMQRRAYEMGCELQDQRDAAEASRAQTKARAERKGAQAKESHAPPSGQTHLMPTSSRENAARSLEHLPKQQRTYSNPLTWTSDRTEQAGRFHLKGEEEEEERVCFWEELADDEQWWNNMVVAELGVVEQQQGSQPTAWPDEDDDTGKEQPISSPPRAALSYKHLTLSCRAVIDGIYRQAGDAQRGRTFQTVAQEGGEQESRRFGGRWGFGSFAGSGEEHGRRKRRCPLRERLREKAKIIVCR